MEKKLSVAVIILTKDEERHIERCVRNVLQISDEVYVVDSESTDRTCEIAERFGATVVEHPWPGNQAEQFNWALDNLPVRAEWILRLDADEYLLPELVEELREKLPAMPEDVSALSLSLEVLLRARPAPRHRQQYPHRAYLPQGKGSIRAANHGRALDHSRRSHRGDEASVHRR